MDAVRTPLAGGPVLALGNRRYRKQILKVGELHYKGGTFTITPDYIRQVVDAFDAGAIKKVPFQLADASNSHTEDPLRRFGTVTSLHPTDDGLDAVIELNDAAASLVEDDPDFGVSVLIKHDRTTGEGQHYPAVLAHILGTTDPVLTSLAPWTEQLAASHEQAEVLDLLTLTAAGGPTAKEQKPMADADTLSQEELAQLRSLLPKLTSLGTEPPTEPPADTAPADEATKPVDDTTVDETDADLADMVAALDEEPELIAASHDNPEVLALSQRLEAAEQANRDRDLQLSQLRDERDESHYLAERENFARNFGIHPSVTDIVKPLLKGAGSKLALANGAEVVPADLIRKFVHEIATRPRLDLSQAKGSALDLDGDEAEAKSRDELAAEIARSLR